jgi:acetyl-CoA carboxylase biotin carboxyl carrier protein
VDLKDIKAIIDLMRKNSLSEFELERADFKIKLKRGNGGGGGGEDTSFTYAPALPPGAVTVLPAPTAAPAAAAAAPAAGTGESEIASPMIGTFYRAPSPDAANYVEVGAEVNADTVVCIIEAMKVMNEIKAESKGTITQILVENAKPVEFGQPMFKIRPS